MDREEEEEKFALVLDGDELAANAIASSEGDDSADDNHDKGEGYQEPVSLVASVTS